MLTNQLFISIQIIMFLELVSIGILFCFTAFPCTVGKLLRWPVYFSIAAVKDYGYQYLLSFVKVGQEQPKGGVRFGGYIGLRIFILLQGR